MLRPKVARELMRRNAIDTHANPRKRRGDGVVKGGSLSLRRGELFPLLLSLLFMVTPGLRVIARKHAQKRSR